MPALPTYNPTYADWMKTRTTDRKAAVIINILGQENPMLDDMVVLPANQTNGHLCTVATGLGRSYWRGYNEGIPPSTATTAQVTEAVGNMERRIEYDADLADTDGDGKVYRMGQLRLQTSGMHNEMAEALIYGNPSVNRNQFMGAAPRMASTSDGNGSHVLLGGGTTADAQTSVYLFGWGEGKVYTVFPKGSQVGLQHMDLGQDVIENVGGEQGKAMIGYREWLKWKLGLVVEDWRYLVRIANVEVGHFTGLTASQSLTNYQNIIHKMVEAVTRIRNLGSCRPAFYMNRQVWTGLSRLAMEKFHPSLKFEDGISQFGTPRTWMSFMGVPIRDTDALLTTEALVA